MVTLNVGNMYVSNNLCSGSDAKWLPVTHIFDLVTFLGNVSPISVCNILGDNSPILAYLVMSEHLLSPFAMNLDPWWGF